ncbi:hypothetical protein H9L10_03535 [Phycicoccus endophyticus]|uniref:Uncharacterized protein n=1 Tax=Phycicoccus endophyticus TaxID=1690220 RepID=A0A7G9R3G6_9MICO|nr:hypothetical protein [Phycicoccus endophyticus]NHI19897.1 hypothetical protein [Phycicoccus endophyticus]QNN50141.1 hypothetical protein H9L10_03535 [Phycicoccus endophyticus]GGL27674.1 hypothetical protein GCM10012283_07360 [Phycicoccus endophyticus]
MAENPALFVRVSTKKGHSTAPRAVAERDGSSMRVLKQAAVDAAGRPLPPKPRDELAAARRRRRQDKKPRGAQVAVTPTPEPETVSGETSEETS